MATTKTLKARLVFRNDKAETFKASNPVLLSSEPAYELDTGVLKIGDGKTAYNDLPTFKVGQLAAVRNFSISGGATAQAVSFDGTSNVNLVVTSLDATKLSGVVPDANIKPALNAVVGYFDNGVAKNAKQLDGHDASYFATAQQLSDAINSLDWRPSVANLDALKALQNPKEGWTVSIDDTNAIYRFDADNTTAEDGTKVVYPTAQEAQGKDGAAQGDTGTTPTEPTKHPAWILIGTTVYSAATTSADGLMSAADKAKLDGIDLSQYQPKIGDTLDISNIHILGGESGIQFGGHTTAQLHGKEGKIYYGDGTDATSDAGKEIATVAGLNEKVNKTDLSNTNLGGQLGGTIGNATIKSGVITDSMIASGNQLSTTKMFVPDGDTLVIDGGKA